VSARGRPGFIFGAVNRAERDPVVLTRDGQTFCFCAEGGKAVYTPAKVGARQGAAVEVLKKQQRPAHPGERARWVNITGQEAVILTHPGELVDGQAVEVRAEK
jgi:hypothetical protein